MALPRVGPSSASSESLHCLSSSSASARSWTTWNPSTRTPTSKRCSRNDPPNNGRPCGASPGRSCQRPYLLPMNELCLVTGGAGFIGSHLVEGLTAAGKRVRVLDNCSTGLTENLAHIRPAPEMVVGDLRDPEAVQAA